MKILILNYEFPPLGGGAGIVTKHLMDEFVKLGHQVTLVTTWFHGEEEFYRDEQVTIIRLKSKRAKAYASNPAEMYSWMKKAKRYADRHHFIAEHDVCLANFTLPGGEVADHIRELFGIPYVVLSHGHDIPWAHPSIMFFWHLLCYPWIKRICMHSSYNIVLSDQLKPMADRLTSDRHQSKNLVFNNGLYVDHFRKSFSGEVLKIVFVGRLVQQKSPMVFLQAIRHINAMNIPYEVSILGDGALRDKMEEFILSNRLIHVNLRGKVSHADVFRELTSSHVLISSSESEGMALAILEALSAGVYVVATPASGNRELIIEDVNGNLVEFNKPDAIAEKVRLFYEDKFTKQYSYPDDYLKKMEDRYAWSSIAKRYEQLFVRLLKPVA